MWILTGTAGGQNLLMVTTKAGGGAEGASEVDDDVSLMSVYLLQGNSTAA